MTITVLDAPSNLGLRMPAPGVVPGCYKLAGALRDQGFVAKLGAVDGGVVVPPRYDVTGWSPGDGVFNAEALARYTVKLADRIQPLIRRHDLLVLLGGDCSILLGAMLGLRRLGRYGLVYLDGHSDFRHVGNAPAVGAAAGEGLAQVTGRGQPDLTDIDGLRPYVQDCDTVVLGLHEPGNPRLDDARRSFDVVQQLAQMRELGFATAASIALDVLAEQQLDGIWVHLDVDVLDPSVMPAVDSPEPDGMTYPELVETLATVLADRRVVGLNVTIYDPDLDEDGRHAASLSEHLLQALRSRA
jgi:arginase